MANETASFNVNEPHVIFRVRNTLFSVGGREVMSIQSFPDRLLNVPNAPKYLRGSFQNQGKVIGVVDLRAVFDWTTIAQEYQEFSAMIDERKRDHITWVETLRVCCREHTPFQLSKDPHRCKLGIWRDRYQTGSAVVAHQLDQLDEPHRILHELAHEVDDRKDGGAQGESEYTARILRRMDTELVPRILSVLDEMKTVFQNTEYREMVLVLQGTEPVGLVVDEVLGVEHLTAEQLNGIPMTVGGCSFVLGVQRRSQGEELIMELDVPALRRYLDQSKSVQPTAGA